MSTSTLSAVDANTGNKIPLATFGDANGNTAVGHVVLTGTPLLPTAPGNPLPVADSAAETALSTLGANTAATMATAGTPADAAWEGSGAGTLVALLKALYGKLAGTLTTTISGVMTVSGASAVGTAPTNPPLSISGVDAQGLKRHLLTDGSGVVQVAYAAPLPTGANTIGSVTVSGAPTVTIGNLPAMQPVSGTVTANQGGAPWSVSLAAGAMVGITGTPTVSVSNLPVTQAVSGTVALGAGSQAIGTVGVTGTVAVADSAVAANLAAIATNTAIPAARVLVSRSVASTTASASTVLVAANAARRLLRIQAPQGAGIWLNLLGGTAGANMPDCLYLAPGDVFEGQDTNAVTYWCATSGLILSAWEA